MKLKLNAPLKALKARSPGLGSKAKGLNDQREVGDGGVVRGHGVESGAGGGWSGPPPAPDHSPLYGTSVQDAGRLSTEAGEPTGARSPPVGAKAFWPR